MSYLIGAALILGLSVAVYLIIVAHKKLAFLDENNEEVIVEDTNVKTPKEPYVHIGGVWYQVRFSKNNNPYIERITSKGTTYKQSMLKLIENNKLKIEYR